MLPHEFYISRVESNNHPLDLTNFRGYSSNHRKKKKWLTITRSSFPARCIRTSPLALRVSANFSFKKDHGLGFFLWKTEQWPTDCDSPFTLREAIAVPPSAGTVLPFYNYLPKRSVESSEDKQWYHRTNDPQIRLRKLRCFFFFFLIPKGIESRTTYHWLEFIEDVTGLVAWSRILICFDLIPPASTWLTQLAFRMGHIEPFPA